MSMNCIMINDNCMLVSCSGCVCRVSGNFPEIAWRLWRLARQCMRVTTISGFWDEPPGGKGDSARRRESLCSCSAILWWLDIEQGSCAWFECINLWNRWWSLCLYEFKWLIGKHQSERRSCWDWGRIDNLILGN